MRKKLVVIGWIGLWSKRDGICELSWDLEERLRTEVEAVATVT